MNNTQQVFYKIDAPQFLVSFKNTCIQLLVPNLRTSINYLSSSQVNHSYSFLITSIVLVLIIRYIINILLQTEAIQYTQSNRSQQFKQLKTQIKNMKSTVKKLMQCPIDEQKQVLVNDNRDWQDYISKTKNLISMYRQTVQQNQKISQYIIDSHEQLIKQIKILKKLKFFNQNRYSNSIQENQVSKQLSSSKQSELTKQKYDSSEKQQKQRQIQNFKSKQDQETEQTNNDGYVRKINKKIPPPSKTIGKRNFPPPPIRKL